MRWSRRTQTLQGDTGGGPEGDDTEVRLADGDTGGTGCLCIVSTEVFIEWLVQVGEDRGERFFVTGQLHLLSDSDKGCFYWLASLRWPVTPDAREVLENMAIFYFNEARNSIRI